MIKQAIPGFLLFGLNHFKPVTISELRNRSDRFDASFLFYEDKLLDVISEKDFDLSLYEKIRREAENMYEMEVGYTSDPSFDRSLFKKYDYVILQKTEDIVKAYQSAYHFNQHLSYCHQNFFNLMRKTATEYIENKTTG
ncbi:MAG: hypothetical protein AAF518_04465 [Spirochaetota bacterium]